MYSLRKITELQGWRLGTTVVAYLTENLKIELLASDPRDDFRSAGALCCFCPGAEKP